MLCVTLPALYFGIFGGFDILGHHTNKNHLMGLLQLPSTLSLDAGENPEDSGYWGITPKLTQFFSHKHPQKHPQGDCGGFALHKGQQKKRKGGMTGDCDTMNFSFVSFMGLDSRWQFTVIMKAIYIHVYKCIFINCFHM